MNSITSSTDHRTLKTVSCLRPDGAIETVPHTERCT